MNKSSVEITDSIQTSLYRIGGASALICAGIYFIALGIYIPAYRDGPPPATVLIPLGGFMLSTIMLSSKVFSKAIAWLGILGFLFLSTSGLFAGYATTGPMTAVVSVIVGITYAGGGLLSFVWYILIGLRLLKPRQFEGMMLRQQS